MTFSLSYFATTFVACFLANIVFHLVRKLLA